jgi:acyl phosphate:glycerol-3-phosphate acyltransferase
MPKAPCQYGQWQPLTEVKKQDRGRQLAPFSARLRKCDEACQSRADTNKPIPNLQKLMQLTPLLVLLLAYLLGSIPFGFLLVKFASGSDIREVGSGGTGATNVTRKAGKAAGILTLVLDALKGACAVWLAQAFTGETVGDAWIIALSGLLAVVGHCFPVWLKFKAGKGVATGLGVFLVLAPFAVLIALGLFILLVWLTRYISLGSICAAAIVPVVVVFQHTMQSPLANIVPLMVSLCGTSALIIAKHSENIQRLLAGKENKFGAAS